MKPSRISLFAAIMLVEFAAFEAGLRLKGGSEAAPAFQRLFMTDSRIGYRLRPGTETRFKTSEFETDIRINAEGTRDNEIGPKAPNERRVVVLGDSIVMAIQVPLVQTFCKRLEDRLNADRLAGPYHYRVINAGVQGYGPVEELLFYQHVVQRFDPDVVLVGLFVGNDAMEAADSAPKLREGRTPAARTRENVGVWLRRIVRRSMVLQIIRLRAVGFLERLGKARPIDRALTMYLPSTPPDMERGLGVTRECVTSIAALAEQHGARTGIVLLPARFQVADDDYARLKEAVAESGETLVRDAATERFARALSGLPLPLMDALPLLRNSPRRAELFFQDTVHLTPLGHQVLADGLERFLLESRLLEPASAAPVAPANRR